MKRFEKMLSQNPLMATIKFARYKFIAKLISPNDNVLDVGCNDGISSNFYSKYAKSVTGVDVDLEFIKEAQNSYEKIKFIHDDVFNFSTKNKFDVIVMLDFIEHFSEKDGEEIVNKYSDYLTKNGIMIIGTPNNQFYKYRGEGSKKAHIFEYNPENFNLLLNKYFNRTIFFSMNDEIIHTGNPNLAWFLFGIGINPKKGI